MTQPPQRMYTVSEYLEMVDWPAEKYEYWHGHLIVMAGGTYDHSLLISRVTRKIGNALEGGPCEVLESNLRIRIQRKAIYRFPDATVICGGPQFEDQRRIVVTNPRLIVEVTSDSTESVDRIEKFENYREIGSFEEYVIVSHRESAIDAFLRQADGTWMFTPVRGIDASVKLRSIDVELKLADLYAGIVFPPKKPVTSDEKPA